MKSEAVLCWPLLALTFLVPYFSYSDIDPEDGQFADRVADEIYRELDGRDWIVNIRLLRHHVMVRAHREGRALTFVSTDDERAGRSVAHVAEVIRTDPSFAATRTRLRSSAPRLHSRTYQSLVTDVADEFKFAASVEIVAAKSPAMTRPERITRS